jgi:hypothetical protein
MLDDVEQLKQQRHPDAGDLYKEYVHFSC